MTGGVSVSSLAEMLALLPLSPNMDKDKAFRAATSQCTKPTKQNVKDRMYGDR